MDESGRASSNSFVERKADLFIAQAAADVPLSFATLFIETVLVTIFIIVLAIVAMRYFIPRLQNFRRNKDSKIQILDFQALDARRVLYIVKIEDKRVAIGVTEHQISKICDLE